LGTTSGGFRIVFDTLVINILTTCMKKENVKFYF